MLAVLAGAALLAVGLERVPAGQTALRVDEGRLVAVWKPGWHWSAPGGARSVRVPAEPVAWRGEAEGRTPEGAAVVADLEGRFAVRSGAESSWHAASGDRQFFDAIAALAGEEIGRALRADLPASELGTDAASERLKERLEASLAGAGLAVENLTLRLPLERNPVVAGAIRARIAALARPTGRKVLVVGWDGADWLLVRPLMEKGRLPNLSRLVRGGAAGELRADPPLLSPLIWTTIATGRRVEEHGIADFLAKDPATGALLPVTSRARKVHALWTVLSAFGLQTDVVGWWATWPAEPIEGTMVTDRVAYQLFQVDANVEGSAAGKVHPPEAWAAVKERLVAAEAVGCAEVRRFVDLPCEEIDRRWAALAPDKRQEDPVNHLRKILATTRSYHAIALDLLRDPADLTMVYYEGTDTFGHLFARYLPPRLPGVDEQDVRRFGAALPEFYAYADELLGELLAAAGPETTVLLMSDHGFFTGEARPRVDPADFATGAAAWHRQFGILVGNGPDLRPGTIDGAAILDIAPTVLALLGLPVPADLAGRVLPELAPDASRAPARSSLASFESLPRPEAAGGAAIDPAQDAERLRELVALGYISPKALEELEARKPAESATPGAPATAPAAPATDLEGASTEAYNLGRILQRRGDYDGAERQYRLAIERLPSFGQGYASLAQVASLRGRHSEALDFLIEGFARSRSLPMAALTGLVDEARQCGRLADAERTLRAVRGRYERESAYHAALGFLAEERGDSAAALAAYGRALEIEATDELAIERQLTLLRSLGREAEAAERFDRAYAAASGSVGAINHLGVVALRLGWARRAEQAFRRVLESDPGNPGVLANLAGSLAQQRKLPEAAAALRESVRKDPENAQNQFNLGAVLAESGAVAEALAAFEAAERHGLRAPRVYVAIAKMRFRSGDAQGAREALERSLALDPGHAESRALLETLRAAG